jgi:sulfhydrogenase subunit beta (sulfur reductase)
MEKGTYKLKKGNIGPFLQKLGEEFTVYAPVESDGVVTFLELTPGQESALDFPRTQKPPKGVFYPQTEVMLSYGNYEIHSAEYKGKPIALFGARPCDTKSFVLLERVFMDPKYSDPYWAARRNNALVFSFACNDPLPSCFCNWLNGGPFNNTGSDILVTDIGDAFVMEPTSENGRRFLSSVDMLQKATEKDIESVQSAKERAESSMGAPPQLDYLKETLDTLWDSPIWDEFSAKCLGCATCTFFCPTCYCFDIQDESRRGKGARIRLWDTCQFPLFTKEGSGHNPRSTKKHRLRQRFMHKFSYMVETQNEFGCVGCGRCVTLCPVNIDIRYFVNEVLKTAQGQGGKG